eukprot:gene18667-24413_t
MADKYPDNLQALGYGKTIMFATGASMVAMTETIRNSFKEINFPFIILHDPDDQIVSSSGTIAFVKESSTSESDKEFIPLPGSLHDLYNNEPTEVLTEEYAAHNKEYWIRAIKYGNVKINHRIIDINYKFRNSDLFSHKTHRHEPPISGNIVFVGENEELVAISKPATLPVHACGAYRYNSLMLILKQEPVIENQPNLHLVHRLDRLTSGLMILAKSKEVAAKMAKIIQDRETKKTYLARVKGRFPASLSNISKMPLDEILYMENIIDDGEEDEVDEDNSSIKKKRPAHHISNMQSCDYTAEDLAVGYNYQTTNDEQVLYLRCPVGVVSYRNGIHGCNVPNSKPAISSFQVIGYCEETDTTLVKCNPIANDPCYGGVLFYNDEIKTKKALDLIQIMRETGYQPLANIQYLNHLDSTLTGIHNKSDITNESITTNSINESDESIEGLTEEDFLLRNCRYCSQNKSLELELSLHCDGIWLHALSYQYKDQWFFETPWPDWAEHFNHNKITTIA